MYKRDRKGESWKRLAVDERWLVVAVAVAV